MDRKLDAGALLVAGAALLLVVSLFLDWFGDSDVGLNAWQSFELADLVLLAAAGAAVASAIGRIDGRVLLGAALVVVAVVVSNLVEPPAILSEADREIGAWLALVAALGLLAGAALTAAQIAVTVDVKDRERRRRVPAVDERVRADEPRTEPEGEPAVRYQAPADRFAPPPAGRDDDTGATQAFTPDDAPR